MQPRNVIRLVNGSLAVSQIKSDPGLNRVFTDYGLAQAVLEHLDPSPDAFACPTLAALLTSTIAAFRLQHPEFGEELVEWGMRVHPPMLTFLKANLPRGDSVKSKELRRAILAA